MAGSDSQPKKATPPRPAANAPRKPLQVMHISRKTEENIIDKGSSEKDISNQSKDKRFEENVLDQKEISHLKKAPEQKKLIPEESSDNFKATTMEDVLRSENNSDYKNIQAFEDQNIFEGKRMSVKIETNTGPAYGRTIADWFNTTDEIKNAYVITNGNSDLFFQLINERFKNFDK